MESVLNLLVTCIHYVQPVNHHHTLRFSYSIQWDQKGAAPRTFECHILSPQPHARRAFFPLLSSLYVRVLSISSRLFSVKTLTVRHGAACVRCVFCPLCHSQERQRERPLTVAHAHALYVVTRSVAQQSRERCTESK